ncbi:MULTISPECIES: protoporphyrinogen oxidase [Bacillus]|uniref:Protoporphyrinogen oxidase n=1 Tax=Bacillus wiedmannii TaxID=1890302 RepID=A0A2B6RST3_9BACI|nr:MULTISPECIES: protoporphyrinogen oxidase [Bacillus]MDF9663256.1 protoporphyrinogen oxidase [Bacillus wiedmannii]MDI6506004.1 protoporphyrinogen oxidase [Bacillus wiedmannii]MDI6510693.1 protoporphyrinogen oxidase [Bacillus wiedmannii]PFZ22231.1 protoporphyrinogen oxidase [Bacillus wiedmannii]PGC21762.1 protoporphyrinogen oxidase [Bacillus wiedmannii]
MINFKPENLNQLLKVMLISANKSYDAIKDYEFTGEAVVFRVDFEYIDVSLMIVDILGGSASKFNILPYARPNTNEIDYIQFQVYSINEGNFKEVMDTM